MKRNENEIKRKLRKLRMITKITKITKYYEKKENNEILRKKRKITKYYEILRKKGNTLRKNHVIVIFYIKTVYFFIHLNNETIAFFLFFLLFRYFRFYSLFVNYDFLLNKIVIVRKRFFSISTKN